LDDELILTARLVHADAAAHQDLSAGARCEAHERVPHPEHGAAQLRFPVLEREVPVPGCGLREVRELALHPQHREPPLEGRAHLDEANIRATIRTLSSDEFGGRAPASAGEKLTTEYIASQFKRYGLLPANHGSFLQEVPLVQITANTDAALTVSGATPLTLSFGRDLIVSTPRPQTTVALAGSPLVFAGYSIVAPEYQWNDY